MAELAHLVADAIVRCHLAHHGAAGRRATTFCPRESEILHLKFWATAFELLKERQAIYFETVRQERRLLGDARRARSASERRRRADKIIVRSNGTVTYVGKDIAYQLWKFGLLGKDFHYRPLEGRCRRTHDLGIQRRAGPDETAPAFGGGSEVYNVIDSRQSYLQDVVAAGLRALGFNEQAEKSVHFSYEMVALTPRTCVELGIELSEEDKKRSYVEVSGRKGLGVKADDLIDKLIENARAEVDSRHPEAPADERRAGGHADRRSARCATSC